MIKHLSLITILFQKVKHFKFTPLTKGTSHRIRLFTPGKWVELLKNEFLCHESFFSSQDLRPMSISAIFKQRKCFRCLHEKRAAATPLLINFAKILSEDVLRIKTTSRKVWAS